MKNQAFLTVTSAESVPSLYSKAYRDSLANSPREVTVLRAHPKTYMKECLCSLMATILAGQTNE